MAEMRPLIGIMACLRPGNPPFREQATYAAMSAAANRMGAVCAVFSPAAATGCRHLLAAYQLQPNGEWRKSTIPLPDVVLERTFCSSPEDERAVRAARAHLTKQGVLLLSGKIGGKLTTYRILSNFGQVKPFLPATEPFVSPAGLLRRLSQQNAAFLKPDGSSKGLGCMRITASAAPGTACLDEHSGRRYHAEGRDADNRLFNRSFDNRKELAKWVKGITAGRRYLVQDDLRLTGKDGCPFDLRSLVQKDHAGGWSVTGIAVRQGSKGGVTANLHGGGKALSALGHLTEQFGPVRAAKQLKQIKSLSLAIAGILEERFGRLVELGLDFGIDPDGRLWFLEANSRPGRASFREIQDPLAAESSASRPIAYALRLASARPRAALRNIYTFRNSEKGVSFRRIYP